MYLSTEEHEKPAEKAGAAPVKRRLSTERVPPKKSTEEHEKPPEKAEAAPVKRRLSTERVSPKKSKVCHQQEPAVTNRQSG